MLQSPAHKWARWGAIAIFSTAVVYALILTLSWLLTPVSP
jgi:hypothetical protein